MEQKAMIQIVRMAMTNGAQRDLTYSWESKRWKDKVLGSDDDPKSKVTFYCTLSP